MLRFFAFLACGPKAPPPPPPIIEQPVEVIPEVVEAEVPMEPPAPEPNVDFNVKLTYSDGSVKEGHVIRLERSEGFYGMKDWYDTESKLTIYAESGSNAKDFAWTELKSVSIASGNDVSCVYESDWNPWLYVCTNKTKSSVIDLDGGKWTLDTKNKWRLTFDDESEAEVWLQNFRALEQDDKEIELGMDAYENPELYSKLRNDLTTQVYLTKVEIK